MFQRLCTLHYRLENVNDLTLHKMCLVFGKHPHKTSSSNPHKIVQYYSSIDNIFLLHYDVTDYCNKLMVAIETYQYVLSFWSLPKDPVTSYVVKKNVSSTKDSLKASWKAVYQIFLNTIISRNRFMSMGFWADIAQTPVSARITISQDFQDYSCPDPENFMKPECFMKPTTPSRTRIN